MRVWIVGVTGGREQAIAWQCRAHGHEVEFHIELPGTEVGAPDLVIVGPEASLAAGVADACAARGIPCFGPTASLARLESSKAHARDVAKRLGIPSPAYSSFRPGDVQGAIDWWKARGVQVVVKQSGLAAGKGVVVPADDEETIAAIEYVSLTDEFVIEERLTGPECSLIAMSDGHRVVAFPIAQDHKRIGEGDIGPNTGGMGAYAPAPIAHDTQELVRTFVQPVIDDCAAAGTPYVGFLYAGLMLTADGPRLIEWNCRMGDPEAQVMLPLMESDLAAAALACTQGRLDSVDVRFGNGSACTVVAASAGYPVRPTEPAEISGYDPDAPDDGTPVFAAGATRDGDRLLATGGRVLAVTGLGADLGAARERAYARLAGISFDGMQFRRDIAWRAPAAGLATYASAGVDIDEGNLAVKKLKASVERTHTEAVLGGIGAFGGGLDVSALKAYERPVLVASADGVGTKVELAARAGRPGCVGADIVNHCIDDVLVQGAVPLFFLDYIAASVLDSDHVAAVVTSMADACAEAGCVLLGGETAEMPGVYMPGAFDIAGTLVGVVDKPDMLPRPTIAPGDVLIGLASSGPHTNGYSFLRKLFDWMPLDASPAPLDVPLGDALLATHRSYLPVLRGALAGGKIKGLAHITGGGLIENVPRVLPAGCAADIRLGSWPVPPLFQLVRNVAVNTSVVELHRMLNMGIGMVVIADPSDVEALQAMFGEPSWVIGEVTGGEGEVVLR